MKKVKVLEMLPGLNYGGSQTMIVNLCANIDFDKVQCDFIIDHPDLLAMEPIVDKLGSKIYTVPSFRGTNIFEIRKAWNEFFETHDYDIIHSHSRSYAAVYLQIAKKHGLKTIIHSHNTSNGKGIGSFIKGIMQLPLRKIADYFFACSLEAGKWLFGNKVVKSDRFYVINNSIDTKQYKYDEDIRKEYRKKFDQKNEKVFIQVGRMNAQKNYLFTLDVFEKYLKINPNSILFIVGDGELYKDITDKIKQLKIEDYVIILQHRDDVNKLLQMADVFLMPSLYEGLSVAAVEAQCSGIRCLMSDAVDKNVNITGTCKFISLDENEWLKAMDEDISNRKSYAKQITDAGFDVKSNAKWLQDFYCSIVE